jgi:hypothetical protein
MRRTHLRGHENILKRVLVHASGFNLGLVMRRLIGVGTPRGLQGRLASLIAVLVSLWATTAVTLTTCWSRLRALDRSQAPRRASSPLLDRRLTIDTFTTGC